MKIIKPLKLGVLHRAYEDGTQAYLSVAVLVFFPFSPPGALLSEVAMWKLVPTLLGSGGLLDIGMPKPGGEVLIAGSAFAPGGIAAPQVDVRCSIGTVDKRLRVFGDRRWRRLLGTTDPVPFVAMPITYERAFGGAGYDQNPLGRGLGPMPDSDGTSEEYWLPNIEDPSALVQSPADRPLPAGFLPYDLMWPQRYKKIGTYDKHWLKSRFPGFAADMDWSIWNAAPPDQRFAGFLHGDEPFRLENMHPLQPLLQGALPGVAARCFVNQQFDGSPVFTEVPMRPETVWLFPQHERGILLFRGVLPVQEDDAADVLQLMAACEAMGSPKPIAHYEQVLARRLDRSNAHLAALHDSELMPPPRADVPQLPGDWDDMNELVRTEGLKRQNLRRRMEKERDTLSALLREKGLDPASYLPTLPPEPPEPPADLEQIPAHLEKVRAYVDEQRALAEAKKAEAEEQIRQKLAALGKDYDQLVRDARSAKGGPPRIPEEQLAKLKELLAQAERKSAPDPAQLQRVRDMQARLVETEERAQQAYRKYAHFFPAAESPAPDRAIALRRVVEQALAAGESLAGRDLTGADLSGLELANQDLRDVMLERADLRKVSLRGALLQGAVLVRADLSDADLSDAALQGANLGEARLHRTSFDRAQMDGAVLRKAELHETSLRAARLARVDLMEASFQGADFSEAHVPEARFLKSSLANIKALSADFSKSTFLETDLTGADFCGATLTSAVLVSVRGENALFRNADLTNLRVVQSSQLPRADFRGARLERANLRGTNLQEGRLDGADLRSADLSECALHGARLCRIRGQSMLLIRADLRQADVSEADLREAILQKADLRGASLLRANLFRADLSRTKQDDLTLLAGANLKNARFLPAHQAARLA